MMELLHPNGKKANVAEMMALLGREKTIQRLRRHIYLMRQISTVQSIQLEANAIMKLGRSLKYIEG